MRGPGGILRGLAIVLIDVHSTNVLDYWHGVEYRLHSNDLSLFLIPCTPGLNRSSPKLSILDMSEALRTVPPGVFDHLVALERL